MNVHHFGNLILNLNLEMGTQVAASEKFNAQTTKLNLPLRQAIINSQIQHSVSNCYKM